jgi:drug/metabolite transporter (DMT)-like permease
MKKEYPPYLAAITVVLIWSGWIIMSRRGVQTSLTPSDITLLRFGTAAILTLPWSLTYQWYKFSWYQLLIVALGCGFPYTMLSFIGLKTIKAGNAGVFVNGMLPVIGLVLGYIWLKEQVVSRKVIAVFILLLANLMMFQWGVSISTNYLIGVLSLLAAALVFSMYMTGMKKWQLGIRDVISSVPIINAVLFLPIWLLQESHIIYAPLGEIISQVLYQGVLVSLIALAFTSYAISRISSSMMSVLLSYVPAVTSVMAYFLLMEKVSWFEGGAILLCSFGLLLYSFPVVKENTLK